MVRRWNAANPDQRIAVTNLDRFVEGGLVDERFDPELIGGLSADAIPAIMDRVDDLDPFHRAAVLDLVCDGRHSHPATGLAWQCLDQRSSPCTGAPVRRAPIKPG